MGQARRTIRDGIVVGLIGYLSVAGLYAAFDFIAARGALFTVDLLGKSVFRGLRDPGVLGVPIDLDVSAIVMYSALHLVASLAIGLFVVGLVEHSQQRPSHALLVRFIIVAGFALTIVAVGSLTSPIRPLLPWWSIVVANVLAVIIAGTYLLRRRPGTWRRLGPFGGGSSVQS